MRRKELEEKWDKKIQEFVELGKKQEKELVENHNKKMDFGDINTDELINDNKSLQILQDINKDFSDTLNFLDEKINGMKDKMERNNFPE